MPSVHVFASQKACGEVGREKGGAPISHNQASLIEQGLQVENLVAMQVTGSGYQQSSNQD